MSFCKSQETPIQFAAGVIVSTLLHHKAHDYCALCTASVTLTACTRSPAIVCLSCDDVQRQSVDNNQKLSWELFARWRRTALSRWGGEDGQSDKVYSSVWNHWIFFITVLISGELFRTTSGRKDKGCYVGLVLCGCGLQLLTHMQLTIQWNPRACIFEKTDFMELA